MSTIDRRIVQMQFDNQGFQGKVQQTISSMKQLGESLKMKGAENGLNSLDKSIRGLGSGGLSALGADVDGVGNRFNAMSIVAATALAKISSAAIDVGTNVTKALTIDPVLSGFEEYELKMDSITTILTNTASKGSTLADVNKTLNELNEYADQTIYNFAEMTRNIGTFTAAGVDLDVATDAIKGIANLAAASGSSSQQASTAMYQLSQALATGKVSLMDWTSVVNAGMGGELFQNALIRTSEVMGTHAEDMIKKYGSFRDSLTKGEWLTGDVLTETLKQLSGAYTEAELIEQGYTKQQAKDIVDLAERATQAATQVKTFSQLIDTAKETLGSGWAQSWEYILGDRDQAAEFFTSLSDGFSSIIKPSANARNEMLKFWNENGGRQDVIDGLANAFQGLQKGFGAIGSAWKEVFPPMTGKRLVEISAGFKKLSENFKMSDSTAGKIKNTFKDLFSALNLGKNVVGVFFKALTPVTKIFTSLGTVLLSITSGIGRFISSVNDAANATNLFGKISNAIDVVCNAISSGFDFAGNAISTFFDYVSKLDFSKAFDFLGGITKDLAGGLGDLFSAIAGVVSKINFNAIFAAINTIITGGALASFKTIITAVKDSVTGVSDITGNITEGVTGTLDALKDTLSAYQEDLSAGTLMKIAIAVALLAGSLALMGTLDNAQLENSLTGLTMLFLELMGAMAVLLKIVGAGKLPLLLSVNGFMISFAVALNLLAVAVKNLSSLSWEELSRGLTGVAVSMGLMIGATKLLSKGSIRLPMTAAGLLVLAAALAALGGAVKIFASMDWQSMVQGLGGVGLALLELVAFTKLMGKTKMSPTSAAGILVLAVALTALSIAVKEFGSMDIGSMIKGLAGIAGMLAEIVVFNRLLGSATGLFTAAAGLTVFAVAMTLMAGAVKLMGSQSWESLATGLIGLAGALTIITVAVKMIPSGGLITTGAGLIVIATALNILAGAMRSMGSMNWEQLGVSLAALAGSLTILAVALRLMTGAITGAIAITAVAGALALLVPQLILLAQCDVKGLAVALGFLAGTFVIFGVAALALSPLIPVMISLAGAFALLSVSCLALAASVALLGTGLTMIAAAGSAAGFALVEIVRQIAYLLPTLGTKIGEFLVNLGEAIGNGFTKIIEGVGKVIQAILDFLVQNIPLIIEKVATLVTEILNTLAQALPQLVDAGCKCIMALLEGLEKNIEQLAQVAVNIVIKLVNVIASRAGDLVQAGIDLAVALINGLADGLRNNDDKIFDALSNLIDAIGDFLVGAVTRLGGAFLQFGGDIITGLLQGLGDAINGVGDWFRDLAQRIIDWFCAPLGIHSPSTVFFQFGIDIIQGLVNGLGSMLTAPIKYISEIGQKIKAKAKEWFNSSKLVSFGKDLVKGLGNGIKSFMNDPIKALQNIGSKIKSNAQKLFNLNTLRTFGKNLIQGLGNAIKGAFSFVSSGLSSIGSRLKGTAQKLFNLNTLRTFGRNLISGLGNGIKGAFSAVSSAISSIGSRIKSTASRYMNARTLVSIGGSLISGLASGIRNKLSSVLSAVQNVAGKVVNAAKKAFKVNSPSKRFIPIGGSLMEGLAKGVRKNTRLATNSVKTVADQTVATMKATLSNASKKITTLLNTDAQPVITPVLDLSEIKKSSKNINGIFDRQSISFDTSGRLSGSISNLQNGVRITNSDVVAAIKDLGKSLMDTPKGDSYVIDGITYDDGSNIASAIKEIIKTTKRERRV